MIIFIKLIDDGDDVIIPALEDAATHDTIAAEVGGQQILSVHEILTLVVL